MTNIGIGHRIGIAAPVEAVYAALTTLEGLAGWWTRNTSGSCAPGGRIAFRFESPAGEHLGSATMAVAALEPHRRVQWRCVDGPPEWIGTELVFDLQPQQGLVVLRFAHRNWREPVEFMEHCSMKWATFLLSLRSFVETGRGRPAPDDLKIDDWN